MSLPMKERTQERSPLLARSVTSKLHRSVISLDMKERTQGRSPLLASSVPSKLQLSVMSLDMKKAYILNLQKKKAPVLLSDLALKLRLVLASVPTLEVLKNKSSLKLLRPLVLQVPPLPKDFLKALSI